MYNDIQALQKTVYSLKSMGCNGRLRALTILFAKIAADLVQEDQKDLLRRALPPFMKDSPDSWLKARKTAGELALKAPKGHPVAKILLAIEALDGPPQWGENKEPCLIVAAAASEWVQDKNAIRKLQSEFVKHADTQLAEANFQGKLPGIQAKRQESAQEPRPSRPQPAPDAPAGSPGRERKLIQMRYELPPFLASLLDEASDSSRTRAGVRTKARVVAEGIDALFERARERNIPVPKRSGRGRKFAPQSVHVRVPQASAKKFREIFRKQDKAGELSKSELFRIAVELALKRSGTPSRKRKKAGPAPESPPI